MITENLLRHFEETPECRRTSGNFKHPIKEFLVIAFLAMSSGAKSIRKIVMWGKENEGRLREAGLGLPYGVPSRQSFDRVFRTLPPTIMRALERRWSSDIRKLSAGSVIAVDGKADYVFGLKGNQKNMHDEFLELFDKCQRQHPNRFATFGTVEKNGGRYERRKCIQTDYVEWFPEIDEWKGLRSVIMVEEDRQTKDGVSHERRLYASSLPLDAERALRCVRGHWGVENGLHWTLDVIFGEDDCRSRAENAAENLAIFRHLVVGVLKQKGKELDLSVGDVVFKGICSREFLFSLVFGKAA